MGQNKLFKVHQSCRKANKAHQHQTRQDVSRLERDDWSQLKLPQRVYSQSNISEFYKRLGTMPLSLNQLNVYEIISNTHCVLKPEWCQTLNVTGCSTSTHVRNDTGSRNLVCPQEDWMLWIHHQNMFSLPFISPSILIKIHLGTSQWLETMEIRMKSFSRPKEQAFVKIVRETVLTASAHPSRTLWSLH